MDRDTKQNANREAKPDSFRFYDFTADEHALADTITKALQHGIATIRYCKRRDRTSYTWRSNHHQHPHAS